MAIEIDEVNAESNEANRREGSQDHLNATQSTEWGHGLHRSARFIQLCMCVNLCVNLCVKRVISGAVTAILIAPHGTGSP